MDVLEIQQLINRYHEAGSLGDYDGMVATFASDGTWEFAQSGKRFVGHAAIREAVAAFTGALEYVAQINAPATILLDGDTATARSSVRETAKIAGSDQAIEAFGIYRDRLVRTAEGWRFARREFGLRWKHRVPILPD